jgi:hypothetical protein
LHFYEPKLCTLIINHKNSSFGESTLIRFSLFQSLATLRLGSRPALFGFVDEATNEESMIAGEAEMSLASDSNYARFRVKAEANFYLLANARLFPQPRALGRCRNIMTTT